MLGTGAFVLSLHKLLVYPQGLELYLRGHAAELPAGRFSPSDAFEGLDLRVGFSDGRSAGLNDSHGMKTGDGPVLSLGREMSWSGSGAAFYEVDVRLCLWVWPIPPPGPVEVTCSWPELAIKVASFVLDADTIRQAAGTPQPAGPGDPEDLAHVPPEQTAVPDLVGMDVHRARRVARDAYLFLERPDPDGPPLSSGRIVGQDPAPGSVVPSFSRVAAWAVGGLEGPPPLTDPDSGGPESGGPGRGGPPSSGDREPRRPSPISGAGRAALDDKPIPGT